MYQKDRQQLPESVRIVNQEVRVVIMASKGQVESLTEEAICPICLDLFTNPVSLECGHNFCCSCITRCWEREERNSCPECREVFADRTLRVNRALARLSEKLRKLNLNLKEKESKLHCEEHQEELKLFCETDKKLICVICRDAWEHRKHRLLLIKEAVEVCKDQIKSSLESLTKKKSDFQEMEQQQKEKISRVQEQSHSLQSQTTSQFAELHQVLTEKEQHLLRDLREEEERVLNPMEKNLRAIQENLNSIEEELSRLQERMNQEDSVIFLKEEARRKERIGDDVQTLSVTDGSLPVEKFDHPHLLSTVLGEMFDAIKPVCVTLDVGTAHPRLEVSEDQKSVRWTRTRRDLPDTRKRFTVWPCVLGSEGFTSGRHYWEVEVAGSRVWCLGVAAKSVERKRRVGLIPENGFWTIEGDGDKFSVNTSPRSRLPAGRIAWRVGVYLSYGSGTVSFYSADTKSHLHTFTGNKFTEKLYPFFWTWDGNWLRICSGSAPAEQKYFCENTKIEPRAAAPPGPKVHWMSASGARGSADWKEVFVTLDVETASPWLEVSEDRNSVRRTRTPRGLPDTGKRFTYWHCVLGSEGFTSGRHYWEVEVAGSQFRGLGVAAGSVEGKGTVELIPENGSWIIVRAGNEFYVNTSPRSSLPASPIPGRLPESEGKVNQEVRVVNMASKGQVESLTEEAICPICLDFFADPVILECGHNFCRSCITRCWEREERNSCPECREVFADRTLRVNRALTSLSEKLRKLSLNPKEKESQLHCEEHEEELKLFCETDKKLICLVCGDAREHREHRFLPIKEAAEMYKDQIKSSLESLTKMKSDLQEMEQQQKEKISGVREQSHSLQFQITSQFAELHQILTEKEQRLLRDLREEEEKILNPMEKNLQEIQENLNSIQEKLSKLQERMNEEDSLIFLKEEARRKRRINDDEQALPVTDGALPVEKFDHPFLLNTALRKMFYTIKRVSVTLDVGTARPELEVSEDRKSVRWTRTRRELPDTAKRLKDWSCVLASEGVTSGRHYWEVGVAGNRGWTLGVAAESVERKGRVGLIPQNGFWTIGRYGDEVYVNTSPGIRLPAGPIPGRVGVYLSYGSGIVSFYSADTKSHLHTFTGNKFTEKLYPLFGAEDGNRWLRISSGSAPGL
ncbi:uncharacterized protein LOC127585818 [Pristis pectinata]|uniref:uncharacterized protein LOC127585818 n=1 Tax=Pristis pectinata TaxID=685728 RepID=UPI00223D15AE|nr:uncharacterized protein LOC127585818 [Pristis pectinata]